MGLSGVGNETSTKLFQMIEYMFQRNFTDFEIRNDFNLETTRY